MSTPAMTAPEKSAPERQRLRLEQLLTVSRRLIDAIAGDIAALEKGAFGDLRTTDPEIERLCAFYGREVKALKSEGGIKAAPPELIAALKESGAQLDALLQQHARLVGVLRDAAEGLIQAVAQGVGEMRTAAAPYTPTQAPKRGPASAGAIVYNKVI